jgi:hypothetical protein
MYPAVELLKNTFVRKKIPARVKNKLIIDWTKAKVSKSKFLRIKGHTL